MVEIAGRTAATRSTAAPASTTWRKPWDCGCPTRASPRWEAGCSSSCSDARGWATRWSVGNFHARVLEVDGMRISRVLLVPFMPDEPEGNGAPGANGRD